MSHRPNHILLAVAMGICLTACETVPAVVPGEPDSRAWADAFVRRIEADDIPDHGVLPHEGTLFLVPRAHDDETPIPLTTDDFDGLSDRVEVTTREALLDLSRARDGARVPFMTIGPPLRVGRRTWRVWLGGDYVEAVPPDLPKLCCCSGQAFFEFRSGRLEFVRWGVTICA